MQVLSSTKDIWERVCRTDEVTFAVPYGVKIRGLSIGIFRTDAGLYAVDNICPHEYALLTNGWVEGEVVECPLHEAKFCLKSGECLGGPTSLPVKTYAVKDENGHVVVSLPSE